MRSSSLVGDEHRLDGAVVVGAPAQLARAVARGLDDVGAERPQRVGGGERLSQRGRYVHHLGDALHRLAVQPAEDLLGAVGGGAGRGHPGAKLSRQEAAQRRARRWIGEGEDGGGHGGGG